MMSLRHTATMVANTTTSKISGGGKNGLQYGKWRQTLLGKNKVLVQMEEVRRFLVAKSKNLGCKILALHA